MQGEQPAHFFAGRDVRLLAILFLVEVRAWLGKSSGRKANQPPALFTMTPDSATGRLALLMIASICPHTAASTLREAMDAKVAADHFRQPPFVVTLGDVVANPRAWRTLHNTSMPAGSVAARSEWLGSHMFEGMVDTARKERSRFVRNDPGTLGHTICFTPRAWFDPYGETGMLRAAWYNVGADHETAFPGCFDRTIRTDELAFCLRVAAREQVGATDMIQDSHARKPDAVRSPNLGKAAGKHASVAPPPTPPTASQRLLLARIAAAGKPERFATAEALAKLGVGNPDKTRATAPKDEPADVPAAVPAPEVIDCVEDSGGDAVAMIEMGADELPNIRLLVDVTTLDDRRKAEVRHLVHEAIDRLLGF